MQTNEQNTPHQPYAEAEDEASKLEERLEAVIKNGSQNLQKLFRQAAPVSPLPLQPNVSVLDLQKQDKSTMANLRTFEEMLIAAYYNRNNPEWDPARPESYWRELPEDDPLLHFLQNADLG